MIYLIYRAKLKGLEPHFYSDIPPSLSALARVSAKVLRSRKPDFCQVKNYDPNTFGPGDWYVRYAYAI